MAAKASAERPRVVTVASIAHKAGRLDFDDLQATRRYGPLTAYRQSKLANLMLGYSYFPCNIWRLQAAEACPTRVCGFLDSARS
jgi:hypothetical protein